MPPDLAALLTPGRTLSADDCAALQAALGAPAWKVRQARLDARDAAIREALAVLAHLGATHAARSLQRAWTGRLRGVAAPPEISAHLSRAIDLHGEGGAPSWTQIARIGRGGRTPDSCA